MTRKLTWAGLVLAGLLGAASVGIVACAEEPVDGNALPECAMPADAVTPELLAFLSKARAAHSEADMAIEGNDTEAAIAALERVVEGPLPAAEPSPEVREVLADTLARTAELKSTIGLFDEARGDIERGLKLATERTHYRGRLLEVRGAVEGRYFNSLKAEIAEKTDAGASPDEVADLETAAEAARQRAIKASQEAIDIQEAVINEALAEDPAGLEE
jgi:hypothetical protein